MKKSKKELEYEKETSAYEQERAKKLVGNYVRAEIIIKENEKNPGSVLICNGAGTEEMAMLVHGLRGLADQICKNYPEVHLLSYMMSCKTKRAKHITKSEEVEE